MKKHIEADKIMLSLEGNLVASRVLELIKETKQIMETEYDELIVDLEQVNHIDSTGITFLIGLYKNTKSKDRRFSLVGVSEEILHLFKLMRLDEIFGMKP